MVTIMVHTSINQLLDGLHFEAFQMHGNSFECIFLKDTPKDAVPREVPNGGNLLTQKMRKV